MGLGFVLFKTARYSLIFVLPDRKGVMLWGFSLQKSDPWGWLVGEAGKETGVIGDPPLLHFSFGNYEGGEVISRDRHRRWPWGE